MAQLQGKWVDDDSVPRKNFDELMDKVGVDPELKAKFKNSTSCMEYTVDGNKITVKASTTAFPGKERTYTATSGVEFDDVGLDGSTFKNTMTILSDSKTQEKGKSDKYGDYEIVRTVDGDKMKVCQTMGGVTMEYQLKRA